jgi:hypothetical protein
MLGVGKQVRSKDLKVNLIYLQPQQVHKVEDKAYRFCAQVGEK